MKLLGLKSLMLSLQILKQYHFHSSDPLDYFLIYGSALKNELSRLLQGQVQTLGLSLLFPLKMVLFPATLFYFGRQNPG